MISSVIALVALLPAVLAQNTNDTHVDDRSSGLTDFVRTGYPTIACITGGLLFLYACLHAARHMKHDPALAGTRGSAVGAHAGPNAGHHRTGWMRHPIWNLMNLLLALFGFFLIFGPDHFASTYANGSPFNSPRSAIIGLQLLVQAALGIYAATSADRRASLAFALFGIFNFLCLAGSNLLFNYNQPIWTLDEAQCNRYFGSVGLGRCEDTGFLQTLRAMGTLALFCEGFLIVASLISYVASHHLTGLDHVNHPVGYAGPVTTATTTEKYPAGYPAGSTYGTSGAYGPTGTTTSYGAPAGGMTSTTQHPSQYSTTTTRVEEGGYRHPEGTHVTHHATGTSHA